MFTGCGTALVTPFTSDGALDEERARALVRRQFQNCPLDLRQRLAPLGPATLPLVDDAAEDILVAPGVANLLRADQVLPA